MDDIPADLLSQLIAVPESAPEDFACAICGRVVSNKWNLSPRDYERPPICKYCEHGYHSKRPSAGSFRDRREAVRLYAIADKLGCEAASIEWERKYYGRS